MESRKLINLKNIAEIKDGFLDLNHLKGIIIIKTTTKEIASIAKEKISDYIDKLSIIGW